jgi:hypothetical protein
MNIYSIFDDKGAFFSTPFYSRNDDVATRDSGEDFSLGGIVEVSLSLVRASKEASSSSKSPK